MLYVFLAVAILGLDVFTKILAKTYLAGNESIPVIKDVFQLTYVENRGAAFGILQNAWIFFMVIALVLAVAVIWLLKEYKERPIVMKMGLSFLCAGALGNTIDRIMQGFVVDFFDFCLIDFPVFNVADIFVCIGAVLLAVFFVFFDNKGSENKQNEKNDCTSEDGITLSEKSDSTAENAYKAEKKNEEQTKNED